MSSLFVSFWFSFVGFVFVSVFVFSPFFSYLPTKKGTVTQKAQEETKNNQLYPRILLKKWKSHILGILKQPKQNNREIVHTGKQASWSSE